MSTLVGGVGSGVARAIRGCRVLTGNSAILVTLSNNTSSIFLTRCLLSIGGGCGLGLVTTRIRRKVENDRDLTSYRFYRGCYGRGGVPVFIGRVSTPTRTGGTTLNIRRFDHRTECDFFCSVRYSGVTATRDLSSGTRALLFHLTENASLGNTYTVPPAHGGVVHPLVGVTSNRVESCLGRRGVPCYASDAGALGSCSQGCVEGIVVPTLGGVGPTFRDGTSEFVRSTLASRVCLRGRASSTCSGIYLGGIVVYSTLGGCSGTVVGHIVTG